MAKGSGYKVVNLVTALPLPLDWLALETDSRAIYIKVFVSKYY